MIEERAGAGERETKGEGSLRVINIRNGNEDRI